MNVAVVGAGISGLSAAYYLKQTCSEARVSVLEASSRLGGVLRTERDADYLIEHAADNFLRGPTAPWAEEFCQETEFDGQLIPTSNRHRGAHVVWQGQLLHVPAGFQLMAPSRLWPILTSRLLSPRGKLRLCWEPLVRHADRGDESLTSFATRRLGRQAFERLVQPLVSGIFTADPDQLSVQAALPQMVKMVRDHGSLYRAMRHRIKSSGDATDERGARYGMFVAPQSGMKQWIDHIAAQFQPHQLHCDAAVQRVTADSDGRWRLEFSAAQPKLDTSYDAVVLAVPSYVAGDVLKSHDATLAAELNSIRYANSVVVALGFQRQQISRPLDAFGSVVPSVERRPILAISYSSIKFPGRAANDRVLMRVFLGGVMQPKLIELDDDSLRGIVQQQLTELLGVRGQPEVCRVIRWPRAMPQYNLGHRARCARIDDQLDAHPGLYLAGNGYAGVGIPQCVRSGRQAAERVQAYLSDRPSN